MIDVNALLFFSWRRGVVFPLFENVTRVFMWFFFFFFLLYKLVYNIVS